MRFKTYERFGHWLTAGSFIALAITGILVLFGRVAIIPLLRARGLGPDRDRVEMGTQQHLLGVHDRLVMIFLMWTLQNIPNRTNCAG